jgi:hypothetical protein
MKTTKSTARLPKGNVLDRLNSVASEIVQGVLDAKHEAMGKTEPINIVMPIYIPPNLKITIEYGPEIAAEYAVFKAKNS